MDKRRKGNARSPQPILQRCAPFLCVLLFATSVTSEEALNGEAAGGKAEEFKDDARGVASTGDHDEEGFRPVGSVASLGQSMARVSKRSIYDSRIPSPRQRYLGTWGSTPFDTTGYDWDAFHDPTLAWGGAMKRGENGDSLDYGDSWWSRPTPQGDAPHANTYMESAYIPHHFFNGFKRTLPYPRGGAYLHRPPKGNGLRGEARIVPPTGRAITRRRRSASLGQEPSKRIQDKPIYRRKRHPSHPRHIEGNSTFHDTRSRRQSQPGASSMNYHNNVQPSNIPSHDDVTDGRREIMKRRAEIIYRRFLGNQL